jgi:hypothetical protein
MSWSVGYDSPWLVSRSGVAGAASYANSLIAVSRMAKAPSSKRGGF